MLDRRQDTGLISCAPRHCHLRTLHNFHVAFVSCLCSSQSIRTHEGGKKHKELLEENLKQQRMKRAGTGQSTRDLEAEMAAINAAAEAAFQGSTPVSVALTVGTHYNSIVECASIYCR